MLLLMPSIPAIQQKSIEEGIKQDIQEKLETINLENLKDFEVLEGIRHPILYFIVMFILYNRIRRGSFLMDISSDYNFDDDLPGGSPFTIYYPILFAWAIMIGCSILGIVFFWQDVSNKLGWNWQLSY